MCAELRGAEWPKEKVGGTEEIGVIVELLQAPAEAANASLREPHV